MAVNVIPKNNIGFWQSDGTWTVGDGSTAYDVSLSEWKNLSVEGRLTGAGQAVKMTTSDSANADELVDGISNQE